jgi:allantoicase
MDLGFDTGIINDIVISALHSKETYQQKLNVKATIHDSLTRK